MIPLIQATLAFLIVCAAVFVIACKLAKPGWESDEYGFQHGEPPEQTSEQDHRPASPNPSTGVSEGEQGQAAEVTNGCG